MGVVWEGPYSRFPSNTVFYIKIYLSQDLPGLSGGRFGEQLVFTLRPWDLRDLETFRPHLRCVHRIRNGIYFTRVWKFLNDANFKRPFTPRKWLAQPSDFGKTRFRRFPTFHFSTPKNFPIRIFRQISSVFVHFLHYFEELHIFGRFWHLLHAKLHHIDPLSTLYDPFGARESHFLTRWFLILWTHRIAEWVSPIPSPP